jgi:hypothetical protein
VPEYRLPADGAILEGFGLPREIAARDSIAIGDEIGLLLQRCLDCSVTTVVLYAPA